MRIVQTDGAETSFAFLDMRENVTTPDSEFAFKPPPGVTVIDGAAPI
jgi:outer membrane lipoprotein-sorting protein